MLNEAVFFLPLCKTTVPTCPMLTGDCELVEQIGLCLGALDTWEVLSVTCSCIDLRI